MLLQENYDQRAQFLTKGFDVGVLGKFVICYQRNYFAPQESTLFQLKLKYKTTKRDHWNSWTYNEKEGCQIIVVFQANTIFAQILTSKYCFYRSLLLKSLF